LDRGVEVPMGAVIASPEAWRPAQIELQLANGRCLRFEPGLDATTLTQLIRVVEGA
jgi:transposase